MGDRNQRNEVLCGARLTRRRLLRTAAATSAIGLGAAILPATWRGAFGDAKPYKLGTVQPLTGVAAYGGKSSLLGVQMAVDRINKSGGIIGRPVELFIGDDESKPDTGRRAVEKMALSDTIERMAKVSFVKRTPRPPLRIGSLLGDELVISRQQRVVEQCIARRGGAEQRSARHGQLEHHLVQRPGPHRPPCALGHSAAGNGLTQLQCPQLVKRSARGVSPQGAVPIEKQVRRLSRRPGGRCDCLT